MRTCVGRMYLRALTHPPTHPPIDSFTHCPVSASFTDIKHFAVYLLSYLKDRSHVLHFARCDETVFILPGGLQVCFAALQFLLTLYNFSL